MSIAAIYPSFAASSRRRAYSACPVMPVVPPVNRYMGIATYDEISRVGIDFFSSTLFILVSLSVVHLTPDHVLLWILTVEF